MKTYSIIFILFTFYGFLFAVEPTSTKVIRTDEGDPIQDLILNPSAEIERDTKTGKQVYVIKGIYYRDTWDLVVEGKRVPTDSTGVFLLKIPVSGRSPSVELTAKGPGKVQQTEKIAVEGRLEEITIAPVTTKPEIEVKSEAVEKSSAPVLISEPISKSETETSRRIKLGILYVAPVMALQSAVSQKNFSVTAGWSPTFAFSPEWKTRLLLGAMAFDKLGGGKFLVTDSAIQAEWSFYRSISLAVGGGFQYWWNFGGFAPEAVGELAFTIDYALFKEVKIDRIYGRFAWVFDSARTKLFQSGVSLSF